MESIPKEIVIEVISYLNNPGDIDKYLQVYNFDLSNNDWITLFKLNLLEYYTDSLSKYDVKLVYFGMLLNEISYKDIKDLSTMAMGAWSPEPMDINKEEYMMNKYNSMYTKDEKIYYEQASKYLYLEVNRKFNDIMFLIHLNDLDVIKRIFEDHPAGIERYPDNRFRRRVVTIDSLIDYPKLLEYVLVNRLIPYDDFEFNLFVLYSNTKVDPEIHKIVVKHVELTLDLLIEILVFLNELNNEYIPDFFDKLPKDLSEEDLQYFRRGFLFGPDSPFNATTIIQLWNKYNLEKRFNRDYILSHYRSLLHESRSDEHYYKLVTFLANLDTVRNAYL